MAYVHFSHTVCDGCGTAGYTTLADVMERKSQAV